MDQLRADNNQVWIHNSELHGEFFCQLSRTLPYLLSTDKSRALEMENVELRRNIVALKTELYVYKGATKTQHPNALNGQGKEGKRSRDVAGSEFQVTLSEISPAKKKV